MTQLLGATSDDWSRQRGSPVLTTGVVDSMVMSDLAAGTTSVPTDRVACECSWATYRTCPESTSTRTSCTNGSSPYAASRLRTAAANASRSSPSTAGEQNDSERH